MPDCLSEQAAPSAPAVVFVPGLRGDVADHWQTLLAAELPGSLTVPPLAENKLSLEARMAALDAALAKVDGPAILVAHGLGVMVVVHWAARMSRPIAAALLVTPPDIASSLPPGHPTTEAFADGGWLPIPRSPLPFASLLAASSDDPLATSDRVEGMARDWRSRLVRLGAVGNLSPAAGYGPWPLGLEMIERLALQFA